MACQFGRTGTFRPRALCPRSARFPYPFRFAFRHPGDIASRQSDRSPARSQNERPRPYRLAEPPRRVLVIDDHRRRLRVAHLAAVAPRALTPGASPARSRRSTLAPEFQPDVCLVDLRMPVMDGYAVAARLRGVLGLGPVVRLVAVTGELDGRRPTRGRLGGSSGCSSSRSTRGRAAPGGGRFAAAT